ncbi:MAG: (2Fe-2S)-binding protein [Oligoflexus sp.]
MYTCLCKGVSDNKIKDLLREPGHTLRSLQKACEAGTDCGMCLSEVKAMIREAQQEKG